MSGAGDETRKGEAITNAAATRSVMPQADGSDSIAHCRDSSPPRFSWSRRAHKRREVRETKKPTVGELFNVANKTQSRFQMFYTELKDFQFLRGFDTKNIK